MKSYGEFVGRLIDQNKTTWQIAQAVLRAEAKGDVKIPFKAWAACDRFRVLLEGAAPAQRSTLIEKMINTHAPQCLLYDPRKVHCLRQVLQDPSFSLAQIKTYPAWQSALLSAIPQAERLFGEHKYQNLKELGIIRDGGVWSEERFQKIVRLTASAEQREVPVNYYHLRLWANGFSDFEGQYRKRQLPFNWLLCNEDTSLIERQAARRLAEFMLLKVYRIHTSITTEISTAHARRLGIISDWLISTEPNARARYLWPLLPLAEQWHDLNWDQFEHTLNFIRNHRHKTPDPALLRDFTQGYVDERGIGKYRQG